MSPDRTTGFGMSTGTEQEIAKRAGFTAKSWRDIRLMVNFPENVAGLRILDIGAGGSDITAHLLERGAEAYALDPKYADPQSLKGKFDDLYQRLGKIGATNGQHAKEAEAVLENQQRSMAQNPEKYVAAYATQLPFPDNYFDLVFSVSCMFSHIDENSKALMAAAREAIRVTKPGGQIQLVPLAFFEGESADISEIRSANQQELYFWLPTQKDLKVAIGNGPSLIITKGRVAQLPNPLVAADSMPMTRQVRRQLEREQKKKRSVSK